METKYWDGNDWHQLGRQVSRGYEVTFDNIPACALFILHDYTEGKEERPFTLHDTIQIWW